MEYSEEIIQEVWEKGRGSGEVDTNVWREDECGAWMNRMDYGRTDSDFGWKIVNIKAGAAHTAENLRPFHHGNGYDVANHKVRRHITADRTGLATFEHTFQPRNRKV